MQKALLLSVAFFLALVCQGQKKITGRILDNVTGQPLEGASVTGSNHAGTLSNKEGRFTLTLPDEILKLEITHVGYDSRSIALTAGQTDLGDILLSQKGELAQIIVTGSRSQLRTKVESPVPVDVINISQITNQVGQVDLNQLLTFVAPSFQSSRQTIADGTDHIDPAQLRGLGSDQVLVLVNGKRRHQSALVNVNGTVNRGQVGTDLGAIPASAIERVEVLRDGAAAQYGSDAIAGVINIVLKKNTNGLSGAVSYGQNITSYPKNYALNKINGGDADAKERASDGNNFQASLNYGLPLKGKGFINLNGEYINRAASNRAGTYTGQIYPSVNGAVKDDSIMGARGTNRNTFDMRIGNSKISGGSVFANSQFDINDKWSIVAFGGFSKKNGEAAGFYRYPTSINSSAGSYKTESLALYPNGFLPLIKTAITDFSLSAGVTGNVAGWDASFTNTYGINNFGYEVANSVNYTQFAVSASPQTTFDAGKIAFIQNAINADVSKKFDVLKGLNLAFGTEFRTDQYKQVAGEEASYKNYNTNSGAASGAQVFAGFTPAYAGKFSRNNFALYADAEQDITNKLLLTGALRFENYSDFGNTLNYKLSGRYKFSPAFIVRASSSSGFRAPSMQQRFYAKTNTLFVSTPGGLVATESGTFPNNSKPAQILGIPELKEETSMNYSIGITAQPIKKLEITVDGYIINIKNRIVLTNNFTGGNDAALQAELSAAGATAANFFTNAIDTKSKGLEAVAAYSFSVAKKHQFKVTAAATFIDNEVKKDKDGKPIIHASQKLVNSGQLGNYFNREDQSRVEVASPRTKGSFTVNYSVAKLSCMLRFAYFGKVVYLDPSLKPNEPNTWPVNAFTGKAETLDQTFSAKTVTDLSVSYDVVKQVKFTIGANNLFDVYQDRHTHSNNVSSGRFIYSRRVQQMGFNGRYLFARVNFQLTKKG